MLGLVLLEMPLTFLYWQNDKFRNRWIVTRGAIQWSLRFQDLINSSDYFLRRQQKSVVYKTQSDDIAELSRRTAVQ